MKKIRQHATLANCQNANRMEKIVCFGFGLLVECALECFEYINSSFYLFVFLANIIV